MAGKPIVGTIANLSTREVTNYGMHFVCRTVLPGYAILNGVHEHVAQSKVLIGIALFGGALIATVLSESVCEKVWSPEVQGLRMLMPDKLVRNRVMRRISASVGQKSGHLAWEASVSAGAWIFGPEIVLSRLLGTTLGLLVESGGNLAYEAWGRKRRIVE